MSITLPNVPPAYAKPRFDDAVVQTLQQEFAAKLTWLERSYHIARVGIIAKDSLSYPQIHANNATNEVFDIRPDSSVKAYSFFEVTSPYEVDFNSQEVSYNLSVIFWGNLPLIDGAAGYDFTGELIQEVTKILNRHDAGSVTIEENPESIFDKYSGLEQEKNQYLLKRYTAFKINFTIIKGLKNDC